MENLTNIASPDDEAGVRLVEKDEKNGHKTSKDKNIEVKYMTPDSQNGDAKIDIENLKTAFAGMGKEELMKYANDPFWVKMRWFLFILFWLIWIAMLAGAIAIIVLAPKCAAPTPREWWEQSPLYQVDVRSFKDGSDSQDGIGDLKGLTSKLDYLQNLGVKTVVLSNILKSSSITALSNDDDFDNGNTVDFKQIDESIGTLEDFKSLASKMKEKGLHLLLSFIPNHSSDKHPWFLKSVEGEEPYKDYYVWASPKGYSSEDNNLPLPPNNWLSKINAVGSAWQWNDQRKMFYLHQFNTSQPDFNFHNQEVVDYFKEVMTFWLDNGASGFHLDKVQYLLEDKELRNESFSDKVGVIHDEYEFYNHKLTSNYDGLSNILQQWNEISANSSGILSLTSMNPSVDKVMSTSSTLSTNDTEKDSAVGQLFVWPQLLKTELTATELKTVVNNTLKLSNWPTWEFVCKPDVPCIKEETLPGIQMVTLLLPGTPVTRSGSELGIINSNIMPWDGSKNGGFSESDVLWRAVNSDYAKRNVALQSPNKKSNLSVYKKLLLTRQSPAIMHGVTNITVLNNHVFTFTRIKAGNPGYLVAFNINSNSTIVDLMQLKSVPEELTVHAETPTQRENSTLGLDVNNNKRDAVAVEIDAFSALVFQFVPRDEN